MHLSAAVTCGRAVAPRPRAGRGARAAPPAGAGQPRRQQPRRRVPAPGHPPPAAAGADDDAAPPPSSSSAFSFDASDPAAWAARRAADAAVDRFVVGAPPGSVTRVGVGAGEAAHHLIASLAAASGAGRLPPSLTVACAGAPAAAEAGLAGLAPAPPPASGAAFPVTDVFFVSAHGLDQTTRPGLAYLTGAGPAGDCPNPGAPQPALDETLAGARAAKAVVALVSPDAAAGGGAAGRLGPGPLPVLVEAGEAWEAAAEELDDAFLGDATVWRRPAAGPCGPDSGLNPRGGPDPHLTPDGSCTLLDVWFDCPLRLVDDEGVPYEAVVGVLRAIPGVRDAGLVPGGAPGAAVAGVVAGVGPGGAPLIVEAGGGGGE